MSVKAPVTHSRVGAAHFFDELTGTHRELVENSQIVGNCQIQVLLSCIIGILSNMACYLRVATILKATSRELLRHLASLLQHSYEYP